MHFRLLFDRRDCRIDQLHHDVELTVIFAHRIDLNDVRMLDRGGDARLLLQVGDEASVSGEFLRSSLSATKRFSRVSRAL